jgi:hypothetical protein
MRASRIEPAHPRSTSSVATTASRQYPTSSYSPGRRAARSWGSRVRPVRCGACLAREPGMSQRSACGRLRRHSQVGAAVAVRSSCSPRMPMLRRRRPGRRRRVPAFCSSWLWCRVAVEREDTKSRGVSGSVLRRLRHGASCVPDRPHRDRAGGGTRPGHAALTAGTTASLDDLADGAPAVAA